MGLKPRFFAWNGGFNDAGCADDLFFPFSTREDGVSPRGMCLSPLGPHMLLVLLILIILLISNIGYIGDRESVLEIISIIMIANIADNHYITDQ